MRKSPNLQLAAARYQPDGQLDTTFGSGGKLTFSRPPGWALVNRLLVQPDGKIVAAGSINEVIGGNLGLARYNQDGTLDAGFGTNGTTVVPMRMEIAGTALQRDGEIVVAATVTRYYHRTTPFPSIAVFRFHAWGTPDRSFGSDGRVESVLDYQNNAVPFAVAGVGSSVLARNIALAPNGQIIVVGVTNHFVAIRYRADGSFESNFGRNGAVVTSFASSSIEEALAAVVQPDGNLLVAGKYRRFGSGQINEFALARYVGFSANEQFVSQVYPDLLGRGADRDGLAFWSGHLDRGFTRDQVAATIQNSPEARTRVIRDSYRRLLGRDAEQAGLGAWAGFLGRGGTAEQMETAILASDEYFGKHGGDNPGFVAALYRDVLGRGPEPGAIEAWSQVLAGGTPRGIVARVFQGSLESDRREVRELYRRYLRREADPAGLEFFAGLLQRGTANEQVILVLVASPEYAGRT